MNEGENRTTGMMWVLELSKRAAAAAVLQKQQQRQGRPHIFIGFDLVGGGLVQAAELSFSGFFEMPRGWTFPQKISGKGDPLIRDRV